jgi:phytoene dehydrogenase-like protein
VSKAKKVVVIGGGISGLASAALLAKAGCDVELFEARERVGAELAAAERAAA